MKGQILGFDGNTGAINGEDGQRYRFVAESWKDERPPQPREQVDFVARDGLAEDIYPLRSAGVAGLDLQESLDRSSRALQEKLAQASASGVGAQLLARARATPTAVVALAMLIFAMMFNYASVGFGAQRIEGSLLSMIGQLGSYGEALGEIGGIANGMLGDGSDQASALGTLSMLTGAAWLFYIVPVSAGWIMYRAYKADRSRIAEWLLGLSGVGAGMYYLILREAVVSGFGDTPFVSAALIRSGFSFGFGGWLLVLGGIAMLLISTGRLKIGAAGPAPAASM
jgi:hypothetical protein